MKNKPSGRQLRVGDALTCLDRFNTAIVSSPTLAIMLPKVLDEVLDAFQCDRAWLIYPCDPHVEQLQIICERTRPEWPGGGALKQTLPANPWTRAFLTKCIESDAPVKMYADDPDLAPGAQEIFEQFHIQSQLVMSLTPSNGPNWAFGIHHCEEGVRYDEAERLFHAVGKRIANGLTTTIAMEELSDSENRYRALVESAPEAILVYDVDKGTYVDANPMAVRLFGTAAENIIGTLSPADLSPEFQPNGVASKRLVAEYIDAALEGDFPSFEWTIQNQSGALVPCEITLCQIPDPTRRLLRNSLKDISERVAATNLRQNLEKRLAQAQKLETVGHMTGGVAHDFNNMLSVIMGNLELLLLETKPDDPSREFIEASITATQRGADLIKNMLSFARRAHLTPEEVDINPLIGRIQTWSARTIPATIRLEMSLAPDIWPILADPASTESSVLNLMINARDAMPEGGILTIETCNTTVAPGDFDHEANDLDPGDYVMVAITDTGTGIPPDQLERVIDPFFTTKPTGKGSGLGLSMVHGFMKQSGGSLHLYSELGVGTTVKLFFPAITDARKEEVQLVAALDPDELPAVRILMAEDQPEVMKVLLRILGKDGHVVVGAKSGDAAYDLFKSEGPFDLLLTDIVMPGRLQGPALARELRALQPSLPVIFMTGYAREAAMHGNGLREEDIRLMKPVSRTDLLKAVRSAITGPI